MDLTALNSGLDVMRIIMRHNKEDPVKGAAIAELTGLDVRIVRKIVAAATRWGFALCSGSGGYYLARDLGEWEDHLEKERGRALDQLAKISDGKKNYVNELTLFDPAEPARDPPGEEDPLPSEDD